jgi:hypothetical protein
MHFASQEMIGKMALAEAGLWATRVNDGRDLVFVVKASTDIIKWIQTGVGVELVIGHVLIGDRCIRCLALRVADSADDPVLLNAAQHLKEDQDQFDDLLKERSFSIFFHNENPFMSVMGGIAEVDTGGREQYLKVRSSVTIHADSVQLGDFRRGQDLFEDHLLKPESNTLAQVQCFRMTVKLTNLAWFGLGVPDSEVYEPWDTNEGGSQETLALQILKPHFIGNVVKSPQIPDGDEYRELCDILAVSESFAFVIESKVFSVFEKKNTQTPERRAKTITGHFEKALGQLQGAMRRLEKGVSIYRENAKVAEIKAEQFSAIHAIVLVSATNWKLPWKDIGKKIQEACGPRQFYHLMPAMELQRIVAFAMGEPLKMSQCLHRRAEVVCSSGNAEVQTEYIPGPPSKLTMPEIDHESRALLFALAGHEVNADAVSGILNLLVDQLQSRRFTGRVEIRHEVGRFERSPAYWLGLGACGSEVESFSATKEWWFAFLRDLRGFASDKGLPVPLKSSGRCRTYGKLCEIMPDLLVTVEMSHGFVVGRKYAD